jgi:hypothetical protein
MARIDLEADEYADLPAWCRPGARVARFHWVGGSSRDHVDTAEIVRITKTRVVFRYKVPNVDGGSVEDWVHRDGALQRYGRHGAGQRLADPASTQVLDAMAVRGARNLEHTIRKMFEARTGTSSMIRKEDRKPLRERADVVELLDEIIGAASKLRARYADQLEQEGS